jgi:hypothetical protein
MWTYDMRWLLNTDKLLTFMLNGCKLFTTRVGTTILLVTNLGPMPPDSMVQLLFVQS